MKLRKAIISFGLHNQWNICNTPDLFGKIIKFIYDWVNFICVCAKMSLSKLCIKRSSKALQQFWLTCFELLDSFSSKSNSEKIQHEMLPDNCCLKSFELCCVKVLPKILAPTISRWNLLLFRWHSLIQIKIRSWASKKLKIHVMFLPEDVFHKNY